jgi:hypothetical protein
VDHPLSAGLDDMGGGDLVELHAPREFGHFYFAGNSNTSRMDHLYRDRFNHPRSGERKIKLQCKRELGSNLACSPAAGWTSTTSTRPARPA